MKPRSYPRAAVALAIASAVAAGCSACHAHASALRGNRAAARVPAPPPARPRHRDGAAAAAATARSPAADQRARASAGTGTLRLLPLPLPGGKAGIGFDDLQYAPALHRLIVPAGRTGRIYLIDPTTRHIDTIAGFSQDRRFGGGHGEGTTSAVYGGGWIFAIDRTARRLDVVDPDDRRIINHAPLLAGPDYVRWIAPLRQVWVTEPRAEQIEVFSPGRRGRPVRVGTIRIAGGPESLVVSPSRGRAYTNTWRGRTIAVDLRTRKVVASWKNGCRGSRGLALDEQRGWLFVGCSEGAVVALDLDHGGAALSRAATGAGVDIIAYAAGARRLYVPAARSANLTVVAVSAAGELSAVAHIAAVRGAHCAVVDGGGDAWICDPRGGRLLELSGAPGP